MTPDRPSAPLPSTWQVCRRAWVLSRTIYVGSPRTFKHNLRWAVTVAARQALSRPWFETLATEEMAPFVHANPRLAFSPLGSYLSRTWNWDQRTKVLLDTYEFINNMGGRLKEAMLRPGGLVLARSELGKGLEARIRLGLDNKFRKEGEVAVFFELAPFPGPVAGMAFSLEHREGSHWLAYVGVMQGRGGGGEDVVKAATKAMHGLRPKSLMVFLAQEIVRALRIGGLRGVGNGIQVYRANAPRLFHAQKKFHFDYDEFWTEAGGELAPDGWFTLPLKTQPRADEDIPGHKRSMYRKRYALLEDLSRQIKIQLMPFHT